MDKSADLNDSVEKEVTVLAAKHFLGKFNAKVRDYILKPLHGNSTIPNCLVAASSSISNLDDTTDYETQIIQNDSTETSQEFEHNCILLINLVEMISLSLKNMDKKYILGLVLDSKHQNLVLLSKSKKKVIGGITYRPFCEQGFTEIVFLAVFSGTHSKGCGKLMMDRLKEEHIKRGILFLLTYGDDKALGFFEKQGFRRTIELPQGKYHGELVFNSQIFYIFFFCRFHKKICICNVARMQAESTYQLLNFKQDYCRSKSSH